MKENQTVVVEDGAGLYDFDELMGIAPEAQEEDDTEPKFNVVNEEPTQDEETPEVEVTEEETTPPSVEEPEAKEIEKEAKRTSNYSNLSKKYIEMGLWEDRAIQVGEEQVPLSELEELDEETFLQITEAQENLKKEKYVNKEDLDDVSRQIFEIKQNGGDITELLRVKEELINPLEGYNLDNEVHQEALVRHMYAMENRSLTQKQIDKLIEDDKKELELDSKAVKFANKLKSSYMAELERKKQEVLDNQQKEKEALKQLKKSLKEELSNLGVKEKSIYPILELVTQKGTKGFQVDDDFQKLKEDPQLFAEYLVWRNSPEDYRKKVAQKTTTTQNLKQLQLLEIAPKNRSQKENRHNNKKESSNNIKEEFFSKLKL